MNEFYECVVAGMIAFPFVSAFIVTAIAMSIASVGVVCDVVKICKKEK